MTIKMSLSTSAPDHHLAPPPLCEKIPEKNTLQRALNLIILFLLVSLLAYRLSSLNSNVGLPWLLALLCESCFAFAWICTTSTKWTPIDCITYPDRLLQRVDDLPSVDMFVTTADPVLEPPIITLNTVLSLLAVDYPANKLACYVSDDGCSPVTFFALVEASKFAKLWVPFCKKYSVQVRAPFRYFSNQSFSSHENSPEFRKDWQQMKEEYEQLCRKIKDAGQNGVELTGEFTAFANADRRKHPAIIKVILENEEGLVDGVPHLVYISREKHPNYPHHYKAGAMNVLTRVSGVMTNAPFMLNVDCDMYANNPLVVLHAMCLLLGSKNERDAGFVQFPNKFYDGLKDDPFGNQLVVFQHFQSRGATAIQGPHYAGTGCFHRRKIIYGLAPDESQLNKKLSGERLENLFGESKKLRESAAFSLSGSRYKLNNSGSFSSSWEVEAAYQVAGCGYENGTCWGTEVGWVYGSLTEDVLTGLRIHTKGWSSLYFDPHPGPPAFLGCVPTSGPGSMTQQKRGATGLSEVLFNKHSPLIATVTGKLQFRACLFYSWFVTWAPRSVPEICYTFLPAYCIITNTRFLPKVEEPAILIPLTLFIMYNVCTLREYSQAGQSTKAWWNNQKMERVYLASAWFFGFLGVLLKLLGISETVFEVTQKEQSSSDDGDEAENNRRFTFDESPMFIPGTTVVLLNLTSLSIFLLRLLLQEKESKVKGQGEVVCSVLVLLCYSPFLKGLVGKGKYGIPRCTMYKSLALTLLFVLSLL